MNGGWCKVYLIRCYGASANPLVIRSMPNMPRQAGQQSFLLDLKRRRDDLARARMRLPGKDRRDLVAQQEAQAVREFSAWFQDQRRSGGIAVPSESRLEVQPSLSREFCIGLYDLRYFIGIPASCSGWFLDMPWLHALVHPGSSWFSLACARPSSAGNSFVLAFNVQPSSYLLGLLNYHFIDVRVLDGSHPGEDGGFRISREVFLTLPIRVDIKNNNLVSTYTPSIARDSKVRVSN